MSTTTKKTVRPLTPNEKKMIIIAAICIAMAIILGVSLPLILRQPTEPPVDDPTDKPGDSSLYIPNGHFAYVDTESTTFPKTADDWKLYTYKAPDGNVHGFEEIQPSEATSKIYAGVVDVDDWDTVKTDLAGTSLANITNPGLADENDSDSNVYMIATKEATSAGIMSENYFYVSSQTSAKVTFRINTSQLKDGSKAYVMLQKWDTANSSNRLSALKEARYSHSFDIVKADGWQTIELYIFNRNASSSNVVCSVGLGNIYDNQNAEGVLFIDDIDYTTVSANDYRVTLDSAVEDSRYFIIGKDDIRDANEYVNLVNYDNSEASIYDSTSYLSLPEAIVEGAAYSPFTKDETMKIYRLTNDGKIKTPVALKLETWNNAPIVVRSDNDNANDHLHISFWVRVKQENVLAKANILLQQLKVDANGDPVYENGQLVYEKDLTGGSFTSVVTNQDIVGDNNCGWTKYDIYLRPTSVSPTAVRIVFSLGNVKGYAQAPYTPSGTLFVTSPFVESISASTYNSGSNNSYSKKLSLVGATSTTTVTNGSFSNIATSNPEQPSTWTPVFACYNVIYKDGKGNLTPEGLPMNIDDVQGKVVRNAGASAPLFDDSEANYLQIENKTKTSFGYLSDDISLSANTVYAFSVLAKASGSTKPFFYVVKNGAENREKAVLGSIESKASSAVVDDSKFALLDFKQEEAEWTADGWTRYYIVVVTGADAEKVRIALFNGSIDGKTLQKGTVSYDYVSMMTLGTYTIDTQEYKESDEDAPATNRDRIKFTAASGYTVFDKLTAEELTGLSDKSVNSNVSVHQPTETQWDEMVKKAMEKPEDPTTPSETTSTPVNWALLASVISSVALVGALLIVVVIKMYKRRSK